jgi:hypothetical protein
MLCFFSVLPGKCSDSTSIRLGPFPSKTLCNATVISPFDSVFSRYKQRRKISHRISFRNVGIRYKITRCHHNLEDYNLNHHRRVNFRTCNCFLYICSDCLSNMPFPFAIPCLLNLQCWHAAAFNTASACAGKTALVASRHNIISSGPTIRSRRKWLTYVAAVQTFLLSVRVPKSRYEVIQHHFPLNISGLDWLLHYDSCFKTQLLFQQDDLQRR